jgi:hypothetical protein
MENHNGLVVGSVTTRASGYVERLAALALIEPHAERAQPISLGADNARNSADFVTELCEKVVTAQVVQNQSRGRPIALSNFCSRGPRFTGPSQKPPILSAHRSSSWLRSH